MARTSDLKKYAPPALPAPEAGPVPVTRGMLPTTTCTQARVQVYQPTQRPIARRGEWQTTPWGRCRVTGRLGQRHADVMEALLYHAERIQTMPDGAVYIVVDPARVRRAISDRGYSGGRLEALLEDLLAAIVEIDTPAVRGQGHLIDEVVEAKARRRDPLAHARAKDDGSAATTTRGLMRIRIGAMGAGLIATDLHLHYDPAPIARLQSGVSQALARHVLTHRGQPRGGWRLDAVLAAVGIEPGDMRNARRRVRADAGGLAAMGIIMGDGGRVTRVRGGDGDGAIDEPPPMPLALEDGPCL